MSSQKLVTIFGACGLTEASYNAGGSPSTSTDGILLREPAVLSRDFAVDGARGAAPGGMGILKRSTPSGKLGSVTLTHEFAGAGAAYSASNLKALRTLLRISGHSTTLDATAAAEKYTVAPESWDGTVPPAFASGVFNLYGRGEIHPLQGAYANMGFEVEAGGMAIFSFEVSGIPGDATEAVLPAITYPSVLPPKADAAVLTIGNYTAAKWRSISFAMNREVSPRSIYGYAAGRRAPTLSIVLEDPSLATTPYHAASTLNPEKLREAATAVAVGFTVGATQYNRFDFAAPNAIVTGVEKSEDGPVALTTVTFELAQSTAIAADDYSIVFD